MNNCNVTFGQELGKFADFGFFLANTIFQNTYEKREVKFQLWCLPKGLFNAIMVICPVHQSILGVKIP
jgi:hypothetical protein